VKILPEFVIVATPTAKDVEPADQVLALIRKDPNTPIAQFVDKISESGGLIPSQPVDPQSHYRNFIMSLPKNELFALIQAGVIHPNDVAVHLALGLLTPEDLPSSSVVGAEAGTSDARK
jgi:hypothetical protein